MINWFEFLLLTVIGYAFLLLCLSCLCLPNLRSNTVGYLCRGKSQPDQSTWMSAEQKAELEKAKKTAEARKEEECAICLETMGKNKIVLLCSHAYCIFCTINFIKSKNNHEVQCPTCRQPARFLAVTDDGPEGPT